MPIKIPHQSSMGIASGGGGQSAQYRSASAFVTPGQEGMVAGLQQLSAGTGRLTNALVDYSLDRQRMENATDLLADKVAYEDAMRNFESDYRNTRQGVSARTAEEDFAVFHKEQHDILYKKWGGNPFLMEGVDRMASGMRQPSMGRAVSYRDQQDQVYKQSVLDASQVQAAQIFGDSTVSYADKVKALDGEIANLRLFEGQRLEMVNGKEQWVGGNNVDAKIYGLRKQFDGAMWQQEKEAYMMMSPEEAVRRIKGNTLPSDVDSLVKAEAESQGISVDLARAIVSAESGGNVKAVSKAGARGPMQLMPGTAKQLGVDPDDPAQNIKGGITYFKQQLEQFGGDPRLALAAYNWGPGNVTAWLKTGKGVNGQPMPKETKGYVSKILGADITEAHPSKAQVEVPGMVARGNISPEAIAKYSASDEAVESNGAMPLEVDGKVVLVPTVADGGRILSKQEAEEQYKKTGKNFGTFADQASAAGFQVKAKEAQTKFTLNVDMQKKAVPTPGLRGGTPLERQAFLEAQQKRLISQQKEQREQYVATSYAALRNQLKGLSKDERDSLFLTAIADLPDAEMRAEFKTMWDKDNEIEKAKQVATDADLSDKFEAMTVKQGWNYAQQKAELTKLRELGLSAEGEKKIQAQIKTEEVETEKNLAATDNLRKFIDEGKVKNKEQIKTYAFEQGMTKKQREDGLQYLENGGQEGAWYQSRAKVNEWLKYYGAEPLEKNPKLYDELIRSLDPGQKLTDETIRKKVRDLVSAFPLEGEREGGSIFGRGRDMTYKEAVKSGNADTWLPDVDKKTAARIREKYRQLGYNNLDEETVRKAYREELGLPVPGRANGSQQPEQSSFDKFSEQLQQ